MIDVVITCRNYGRFLSRAIDSCLAQTVPCNVIVVNDGSTDNTVDVVERYWSNLPTSIRYFNSGANEAGAMQGRGLAVAANLGIKKGNSPLVCRLDADDWLHPDFCLMMESYFQRFQKTGAVFSDFFLHREDGTDEIIKQSKDGPHGSCVVFDRYVFEATGGYDESLPFQEDYDFWKRLVTNNVLHINIPLWYYRVHGDQMSSAWNARQKVRHDIKEKHQPAEKVLAVIPARGNSKGIPGKNMRLLGGVPLVARAIRMAKRCERDMQIVVSTEDDDIATLAVREGVAVVRRPPELSEDDVSTIAPVKHAMEYMDAQGWKADVVVSIQATDPFTPPSALAEGIDAVMGGASAAVSVAQIMGTHPYRAFHLTESRKLVPYFENKAEKYLQRQDRPLAYGFTGGFYVRRRELLEQWKGLGYALGNNHIGIVVPPEAAVDIDTMLDLWLAETILAHRGE